MLPNPPTRGRAWTSWAILAWLSVVVGFLELAFASRIGWINVWITHNLPLAIAISAVCGIATPAMFFFIRSQMAIRSFPSTHNQSQSPPQTSFRQFPIYRVMRIPVSIVVAALALKELPDGFPLYLKIILSLVSGTLWYFIGSLLFCDAIEKTESILSGKFQMRPEGSAREQLGWEAEEEARQATFAPIDLAIWLVLKSVPIALGLFVLYVAVDYHSSLIALGAATHADPSLHGVSVGTRIIGILLLGTGWFCKYPLGPFFLAIIRRVKRPETIDASQRPTEESATRATTQAQTAIRFAVMSIGAILLFMPPYVWV